MRREKLSGSGSYRKSRTKLGSTVVGSDAETFPGTDSAKENTLFLKDVEDRRKDKDWKVTALQPAQFNFRVCANGHMVEIVNADWEPTIRGKFEGTGADYSYRMFLSKIKGQWIMVR
jgi:hypothetical protein